VVSFRFRHSSSNLCPVRLDAPPIPTNTGAPGKIYPANFPASGSDGPLMLQDCWQQAAPLFEK
jgi:hypothetical protein